MAINFLGRTDVKYFMQTQLLRFCKDAAKVSSLPLLKITTESTHFLFVKKKIPICGLNFKQMKYKRSQKVASKHRTVKNLQIAKTFFKKCEYRYINKYKYNF